MIAIDDEDDFEFKPEVTPHVPSYRFAEFINNLFLNVNEEMYLESIRVKPQDLVDSFIDPNFYYARVRAHSLFIQSKLN